MHVWLLAALLLAVQALGLSHRIGHPYRGAPVVAPATGGHHAQASFESPYGHEQGDAACRLMEQIGHADALCDTAAARMRAPVPAGAPTLPATAGSAQGPVAPYSARAPPRG